MSTLSRRRFLRIVTAVGGMTAVSSLMAACQSSSPAPPAGGASGPPPAAAKPTEAPKPTEAAKPAAAAASPAIASSPAAAPSPAAASSPAASPAAQAAPAAPAATGGATSFKIGATIPLTGRYAALGEQVRNGYELAFTALSAAGATHKASNQKFTLELKVLDDESDATKTVQRLESHTATDQVLAYLGGAGSDLHAVGSTVADKNKTPYLGVAFALYAVHQKGLKYLFSPFPKSPQLVKSLFAQLDGLSPKPAKVGIFSEQTDWGNELRDLWKKEAADRKYELVVDEQYAGGSKDFSPMILKAKSAAPDALFALPTPPDGIAIVKQMKELDFNAKYYWFIRASDNLSWGDALGKDGNGFINAPGWSPDLKFPGVAELKQAHQAKYNKSAEALTGAAYATVQILFDAVARSAKLGDRDALRDALAATDLTTVAGPIKFNPDGTAQMISVFNQWQGGKQVLVWPKDQKDSSAQFQYPVPAWNAR